MELNTHLVRTGRVVRLGDDEHVLLIEPVERAMAADLESARHIGVMVAPAPDLRQRVFERHACLENGVNSAGGAGWIGCCPERSECPVGGGACGRGLLRRRGKRDGKADGDNSKAYGA